MTNEGLNKLGHAVDSETGETVMEVFGPPRALHLQGADTLSRLLYGLSEVIIRGIAPDTPHGYLGGDFGYGADFENEVFLMHHYGDYNDPDDPTGRGPDYPQRFQQRGVDEDHPGRHYYDPPLFWHKASNFRAIWYKWIGRDMATNRDIPGEELHRIFTECWGSIPREARDRAVAEHEYENTPKYLAESAKYMAALSRAIWESIKAKDFKNPMTTP